MVLSRAILYSTVIIFVVCWINIADCGWCSRTVTRYWTRRVCCRWDWGVCTWWEYRRDAAYALERYCCVGWKGSNCDIPICNPGCGNYGSCTLRPNHCQCDAAHTGSTCGEVACSYLKPCFPGKCQGETNCVCAVGFDGPNCTQMLPSHKPHITHASTTMKYIPRTGKFANQLMYWFMSDASEPNSTETDHRWIHFKKFNILEFLVEAMYTPPNIESYPYYVTEYKFGIVAGSITAELVKVPRTGSPEFTPFQKTYNYSMYTGLQRSNPEEDVARLNISDPNFSTLIESGDNLTIQVTVESGGYAKLKDLNNNPSRTMSFNGQTAHKKMVFHFDFEAPYHCSENYTCSQKPIEIGNDITKISPSIDWSDWKDELGGVFRFNLEIHHLKPDLSGNLTEFSAMEPFFSVPIFKKDLQLPILANLTDPGMYSIVLDVADKANNSRFARQFVLFDPVSNISLDTVDKLLVLSAQKETHYQWQSNIQDVHSNGPSINVTWKGHFRNKFHEDNKLLNAINSFHATAMDGMYLKDVDDKLDDLTGHRTRRAIPNSHGIVSFQIAYQKDHSGGRTFQDVPTTGWTNVANILSETQSINVKRENGDTIKIWIRAEDSMGNVATDYTTVSIDTTAPTVTSAEMHDNIKTSQYNFGSRVVISTQDLESGIHKIDWSITDTDSGNVVKKNSIGGNKTQSNPGTLGNTTPNGDYFYSYHTFDINNCWLAVSKADLPTKILNLTLSVYNMAMQRTTRHLQISNLTHFDGMMSYAEPMNLKVNKTFSNGVKLTWTPGQSCFEISTIIASMSYTNSKGQTINESMHIDKSADWYNLIGLHPGTQYTIKFVTEYGEDRSDSVYISFVTDSNTESKSSAAAIAGSVSAVIIILLIIITILFLWRTGRIGGPKRSPNRYEQTLPNINQQSSLTGVNNKTYETDNDLDDIYVYGGMKFDTIPAWIIPHKKIVLEEKIKSGRFADIFKARYDTKQNDMAVVVAKTLQDMYVSCALNAISTVIITGLIPLRWTFSPRGCQLPTSFNEDDKLLMMTKINFFATQVGQHANIINFIGAVTDNIHLGPYMILEYCEEGNLRDWLLRNNDRVGDEVVEKLFQIILGVSNGMKYLSSKKIVHRRLAARNILLPFILLPKITGFGPTTKDDTNNKDDTKEMVPVKWMAPECTENTKNATTKSDVWSYGIVMWEILSLGETPYNDMSSRIVPEKIQNGYRLKRPEHSTDIHHRLMKKCWNLQPEGRPDFKIIVKELEGTFKTVPSDDYYYDMQK